MEPTTEAPAARKEYKSSFLMPLVFWKLRNVCPDFTLIITPEEKAKMDASLTFQEQQPVIKVEEVKAGLRIRMEDARTGNNITVTESTDGEFDAHQRVKKFREAIQSIPGALKEQQGQENSGVFTSTDLQALLRTIHATAPVA